MTVAAVCKRQADKIRRDMMKAKVNTKGMAVANRRPVAIAGERKGEEKGGGRQNPPAT
jgi:hypothetical protein